MGNTKKINIKNRKYYFFDDIINIKHFETKSHTKTLIFITLGISQ